MAKQRHPYRWLVHVGLLERIDVWRRPRRLSRPEAIARIIHEGILAWEIKVGKAPPLQPLGLAHDTPSATSISGLGDEPVSGDTAGPNAEQGSVPISDPISDPELQTLEDL